MVSIFVVTIWLLGYKIHPYSLAIFIVTLCMIMVRLSTKPFHVRMIISMAICMGVYYLGDICIGLITSPVPFGGGFVLYTSVLIGMISILSILNDRYHYINPNWKMFGLLLFVQMIILVGIFTSGYFLRYKAWGVRDVMEQPPHHPILDICVVEEGDPHNWQLGLQQLIWYTMWVPLVGGVRHPLSNGQVEVYRKKMEEKIPFQRWWHNHRISEIMKLIPEGNSVVLDLGCGCGDMFVPLQEQGKDIIGLDIDPEVIEYLKLNKDLTGIRLLNEDALSTSLEDESVDVVLILDVLEHFDDPRECLREINRMLKPDGMLILCTPHNILLWRVIWWFWTILMPYNVHGSFTKEQILSMLEETGIPSKKLFSINFGCLLIAVGRKERIV